MKIKTADVKKIFNLLASEEISWGKAAEMFNEIYKNSKEGLAVDMNTAPDDFFNTIQRLRKEGKTNKEIIEMFPEVRMSIIPSV